MSSVLGIESFDNEPLHLWTGSGSKEGDNEVKQQKYYIRQLMSVMTSATYEEN